MYGSRESRIPHISTKGFFGRYSQRVESIFFFLRSCATENLTIIIWINLRRG